MRSLGELEGIRPRKRGGENRGEKERGEKERERVHRSLSDVGRYRMTPFPSPLFLSREKKQLPAHQDAQLQGRPRPQGPRPQEKGLQARWHRRGREVHHPPERVERGRRSRAGRGRGDQRVAVRRRAVARGRRGHPSGAVTRSVGRRGRGGRVHHGGRGGGKVGSWRGRRGKREEEDDDRSSKVTK